MAVYTAVSAPALREFLSLYELGNLVSHEGIAAGVSNTNYFVDTDKGRYVLTLFEPHRVSDDDIGFFSAYTDLLFQSGLPVPEVIRSKNGALINRLCDRPACFYSFLEGEGGHAGMITPDICAEAGQMLGMMHLAAARMDQVHPDPYGPDKWRRWIEAMADPIAATSPGLLAVCVETFNELADYPADGLTSGPIHGDFFPDNVFFKDGEACGVIDFHFASTGWFLYDLAIAVNAWCFNQANEFEPARYDAMMAAYKKIMPLPVEEYDVMPMMLRLAAMRFLLSRIEEKANWTADRLGQPHDPLVFLKRLEHFRA